jgi:hypothetical protein
MPTLLAQVPSNVLLRVRMIKAGNEVGTGFTVEVDERQYLITAKHVAKTLKAKDTIQLFQEGKWSAPLNIQVFRCDDPIDIAVLVPPEQISVTFDLAPRMQDLFVGQDAYFVGFPYGLVFNRFEGKDPGGLYPLPFIKKATISALADENGVRMLFLDGHNNPGFSGAPIVYRDLHQPNQVVFRVAGVVSAYRAEQSPVLTPEQINPNEASADDEARGRIRRKNGLVFRLRETDQAVEANTGIVVGFNIVHAVDLIHKNPIGPRVAH